MFFFAMVGGLAHSGRVIFAAAAVRVAVFFTFAISGPLPPKEIGVVLGVAAILLDALLLRLLLPVLLRLAGRAAWASPAWPTRILPTVRFSHGTGGVPHPSWADDPALGSRAEVWEALAG